MKTVASLICSALALLAACGTNQDFMMCDALAIGEFEVAAAAIEHGADVDRYFGPGKGPMGGSTCLMASARTGALECVQFLLDHDADPNAGAPNGLTPLMLAAGRGHVEVVRLLLERGADPARETTRGETALGMARAGGHDEIVALLSGAEDAAPGDRRPAPAS